MAQGLISASLMTWYSPPFPSPNSMITGTGLFPSAVSFMMVKRSDSKMLGSEKVSSL